MKSFPLARAVPDTTSSLKPGALAPATTYDFQLGIGDAPDGYNVLHIDETGDTRYQFRVSVVLDPTGPQIKFPAECRLAQFRLTRSTLDQLLARLRDVSFHKWDREYHADVEDGLQVFVTLTVGNDKKLVYFNNRFPEGVQSLLQFINNEILQVNKNAIMNATLIKDDTPRYGFPDD